MSIRLAEWASLAEILGAVAVVVSLFFVGSQISEGNDETRAATTQAALDAEMVFQAALVRHADVWENVVMGGDTSDKVATRRSIALYNMVMTLNDNRFQMMNSGYLEVSVEGLRRTVMLPFYDIWRASPGAAGRSRAFLEYVDDMRHRETTR